MLNTCLSPALEGVGRFEQEHLQQEYSKERQGRGLGRVGEEGWMWGGSSEASERMVQQSIAEAQCWIIQIGQRSLAMF